MVDMEKGFFLRACHLGRQRMPSPFSGSCGRCHTSAPELQMQSKGAGPTPFSHKFHISLYKCDDCHNKLFTTGLRHDGINGADGIGKSCGASTTTRTPLPRQQTAHDATR